LALFLGQTLPQNQRSNRDQRTLLDKLLLLLIELRQPEPVLPAPLPLYPFIFFQSPYLTDRVHLTPLRSSSQSPCAITSRIFSPLGPQTQTGENSSAIASIPIKYRDFAWPLNSCTPLRIRHSQVRRIVTGHFPQVSDKHFVPQFEYKVNEAPASVFRVQRPVYAFSPRRTLASWEATAVIMTRDHDVPVCLGKLSLRIYNLNTSSFLSNLPYDNHER
jgi:hypothetical protein